MKKVLVFYWYVPQNYWHPIYNLHLRNLFLYKNVFDEIHFFISVDEDSSGILETVNSIKYFLPDCSIHFVRNNKEQRESTFFYERIVRNLEKFTEDTALFFAHNKGVQSNYVSSEDLDNWINTMYYFNLRDVKKIDGFLQDKKTCCVGCGRMTNYAPHEFAAFLKYKWMFAGTFFWIVPNRIAKYVKEHNVELYDKVGRYYTEGFLGTIFPSYAEEIKCTIPDKILKENWSQYVHRVVSQETINDYISVNGDFGPKFLPQPMPDWPSFPRKEDEEKTDVGNVDIFIITHKNFETKRTNPIFKIVCSETDDVTSDKLKVIKVKPTLANDGWSEWQKIYEIYKGQAGPLKDYVGLCHYHRYIDFGNDVNIVPPMESLFSGTDVSICNVVEVPSVRENYAICHNVEDFDLCGEIIKEKFPKYLSPFEVVSRCDKLFAENTLILRKDDFYDMCDFIFGVLLEYCKRVGIDPCSNESFHEYVNKNIEKYSKKHHINDGDFKQQARIPAFLSERLLTVWVIGKCNNFRLFSMRED